MNSKYTFSENNFNFNSIEDLARHFASIISAMDHHSLKGILPMTIAGNTWDIDVNHTYEDLKEELKRDNRQEDLKTIEDLINF